MGDACGASCRAATGGAEQSSQGVQAEEEEGKRTQRHAGTIQHAADAAACGRLIQQAKTWLPEKN